MVPLPAVNAGDLKTITPGNFLCKFADDTYLIVPASSEASRLSELHNIQSWAEDNNLRQLDSTVQNPVKSYSVIPNEGDNLSTHRLFQELYAVKSSICLESLWRMTSL